MEAPLSATRGQLLTAVIEFAAFEANWLAVVGTRAAQLGPKAPPLATQTRLIGLNGLQRPRECQFGQQHAIRSALC